MGWMSYANIRGCWYIVMYAFLSFVITFIDDGILAIFSIPGVLSQYFQCLLIANNNSQILPAKNLYSRISMGNEESRMIK